MQCYASKILVIVERIITDACHSKLSSIMLYVSLNDDITLVFVVLTSCNFNLISSHIVTQAVVETSFIEGLSHSRDSLTGDF